MPVKPWPDFDTNGDMPPGVYPATLSEVMAHFGTRTPERQRVARRLEQVHALALASGSLARFFIFGSFVTAKPVPSDIDIFLLIKNDFDTSRLPRDIRIIFDHAAAQNLLGADVSWMQREATAGGERAVIEYRQITRSCGQRGIVEVISND